MKAGDLVLCTYQGRNAVCILVADATTHPVASESTWWTVCYPDGEVLTVHRTHIREIKKNKKKYLTKRNESDKSIVSQQNTERK